MINQAKGVAVLAHSGGPTAVINATLLGVVEQVGSSSLADALYGAQIWHSREYWREISSIY